MEEAKGTITHDVKRDEFTGLLVDFIQRLRNIGDRRPELEEDLMSIVTEMCGTTLANVALEVAKKETTYCRLMTSISVTMKDHKVPEWSLAAKDVFKKHALLAIKNKRDDMCLR